MPTEVVPASGAEVPASDASLSVVLCSTPLSSCDVESSAWPFSSSPGSDCSAA
ncbi:hypothetical protein [Microbacterium sp. NIBRBAC000506063]|uniref:hypothetical protein n=1 Tax=Microbacterium sp. NIBRBAC000506063 TaxID=2734618 RepID=UPI001BB6FCDC|nr:hypothetical protein [Microbacterium sp. NIBRBAC000506063]QTV78932.1 hypothetical protein KAE78_06935 [Microbacterium sp. NIBRBAC000506063]